MKFVDFHLQCLIEPRLIARDPKRFQPRFSAGDAVRVVEGAFSDCLGLFESMTDSERVLVLLDLLGRKVRVTMNMDTIEAA